MKQRTVWLGVTLCCGVSLLAASYARYAWIEAPAIAAHCDAGAPGLVCTLRAGVIQAFIHQRLGWTALGLAALAYGISAATLGASPAEPFRPESPRNRQRAALPPSSIAPTIDSSASPHATRFSAILARKALLGRLLAAIALFLACSGLVLYSTELCAPAALLAALVFAKLGHSATPARVHSNAP